MTDPVELKLAYPITVENQQVDTLTMTRLNGKKLRQAGKSDGPDYMNNLIAQSANIPPSSVDQMDGVDIFAATKIVADFLGVTVPTTS